GWLGADLIFDLDADHLRGSASLGYAAQLDLVKERTRDLIDDFLRRDFGVSEEGIQLVFSGGRGYHVHVRDEAFHALTSPERRELVEYVMGVGFDPATAVDDRREDPNTPVALEGDPTEATPPGKGRAVRSYKRLYPSDAPGWKGRMTRSVVRLLARWEAKGARVAAAEMEAAGLPGPVARRLARLLLEEGRAATIRSTLSLEVFKSSVPEEFLRVVLGQAAIEVQGETDAPVTTDIHRLIRLPGSLHGGTGLKVVPLERTSLDGFDPLRDAVVASPDGETAEVELTEPVEIEVGGSEVRGANGDVRRLPTPVALFLVLRGQATLRP
ncbi:MAG TPA: DNA primase small subunit domain-containing protein, partial [Thermoplasmata archaeon]